MSVTQNPQIRVLFVAHSPNRGGAEYCLDTTLRYLDRELFEPIVVFPFEGPMADAARTLGIETIVTPMCHWLYFKKGMWYWRNLIGRSLPNIKRLKSLIVQHKIDVVYTNTSAIFEPSIAARRAGVPHLWHIHEVLKPENRMSQLIPITLMQRFIRSHSDQIIFESQSALNIFDQTTPVPDAKIVHNSLRLPIDERPSEEAVLRSRQRLGLRQDRQVIACVGQFIDRKNPLLLIEAVDKIKNRANIECLFVGEGPLEPQIRKKIATFGLGDQCKLIPFQNDIRDVLTACDILALPSIQESFGLVLLEAAAFRKPVVACQSQGPSEIIIDGKTGFLTRQNNAAEMADAFLRLIEGKALQAQFGNAGYRRVQELFSPVPNTLAISTIIAAVAGHSVHHETSANV